MIGDYESGFYSLPPSESGPRFKQKHINKRMGIYGQLEKFLPGAALDCGSRRNLPDKGRRGDANTGAQDSKIYKAQRRSQNTPILLFLKAKKSDLFPRERGKGVCLETSPSWLVFSLLCITRWGNQTIKRSFLRKLNHR